MRRTTPILLVAGFLAAGTLLVATRPAPAPERRIIDMHLHALPAEIFPDHWDGWTGEGRPLSNPELLEGSVAALEAFGVERAVTSGMPELVAAYREVAGERIVPSLMISAGMTRDELRSLADSLEGWYEAGRFHVIGEVATQYAGIPPADPALEPIFAFAEREGVPVGIHMGTGPPGVAYEFAPNYRVQAGDPLELEEVLLRHPGLKVYVMHAGYPMLDSMLALLHMHPQVYAELSMINWAYPREEFHRYLRTLVDAGFADRLLFGSDQMVWPDLYGPAVEGIESAEFLSEAQKEAIFYGNAARFLGLDGAPGG